MSVALSEFWTRIVRAGLADAKGCKQIAASFRKANGEPPADSRALAKFLVRRGRLNRYQAASLLADRPPRLRFGEFVRIGDASPSPLSRWLPVRSTDGDSRGHLLPLGSRVTANPGSLARLREHADVAHPSLQPLRLVTDGDGEAMLFTTLPPGTLLSDWLAARGPLSEADAIARGLELGEALATLHGASLVHGQLAPPRVWITESDTAILLRDPLTPPDDSPASPGPGLDPLPDPQESLAPERFEAGNTASPAADVYPLGCLVYRLVRGHRPVDASDSDSWAEADRRAIPAELAEAVREGRQGNPLFRVLAHALAKRPEARFADARGFVEALRAAGQALAGAAHPRTGPTRQRERNEAAAAHPPRRQDSGAPETAPHVAPRSRSLEPKPGVADVSTARESPAAYAHTAERHPRSESPHPREPDSRRGPEWAWGEAQPASASPQPPAPPPSPAASRGSSPADPKPRRRRRKQRYAPFVLGGLGVAALVLMIAVLVSPGSSEPEPVPDRPRRLPPGPIPSVAGRSEREPAGDPSTASPSVAEAGYELVDDQRLLWVPPYGPEATAASTELLPPGPGIIATVRLADLTSSAAGRPWVELLSPELSGLIELAEQRAGVAASEMRRVSLALHPGTEGRPEVSLAVELAEPQPLDELTRRWNVAEARTPSGATIYAGDEPAADAYFVAPSEDSDERVSRFSVGSVERISEVAELDGAAIPLPRPLERLWMGSSGRAHFVALVTPNFLFADARKLLDGAAPRLADPLRSTLVSDASAWLVTASLDGELLYAETRLMPSGGATPADLLRGLDETIEAWPAWARGFVLESLTDPSWRLLANRLPSMLEFVADHVRLGVVDEAAAANVYLPSAGARQVALASWLAMNTPRSPAGQGPQKAEPREPLTVDEMLDREMSVRFDQESLEFAVDTIVDEFSRTLPPGSTMPEVRIVGADLELQGITQNQQIRDFEVSDEPLRDVLTALVVAANPDKSAESPAAPEQALVWVVAEDPDTPGQPVILITTRAAARDKYSLPEEFRPDGASD